MASKTATCAVYAELKPVPVSSLELDRHEISLEKGQTTTLIANVSPADWLHPQKTKADMNDGEITIAVDANQTNYVRTGKVHVHPVDHPEFIVETFTIEEASAYYSISQTSITCESAGGDYSIDIQSSRGMSVRSSAGWVNCWLNERGNYRWTLGVSIGRNTGESSRNATITVLNGDGTVQLGTISITQLAYTVDHAKDFIIKVRAAAV